MPIIYRKRKDRIDMVGLCKSGQKLIRSLEIFEREMPCAFLTHPCEQRKGIINHVSQRHGIMNCRLIFDAQQNVGGILITICHKYIPRPRELCLASGIPNHFAEQPVCGYQCLRLNDLFTFIQISIEQICKDLRLRHESVDRAVFILCVSSGSLCHRWLLFTKKASCFRA